MHCGNFEMRNFRVTALGTEVLKRFPLIVVHVLLFRILVLSTCPLHTNSGCGKERRILIGPW